MSKLEFKVESVVESDATWYLVSGHRYEVNPPVTFAVKSLDLGEVHEGCRTEPFMELSHADAVFLMDQLYACGIRPSEDIKDEVYDEVGFLKELLRRQDIHLADIRSVLELEAPKDKATLADEVCNYVISERGEHGQKS